MPNPNKTIKYLMFSLIFFLFLFCKKERPHLHPGARLVTVFGDTIQLVSRTHGRDGWNYVILKNDKAVFRGSAHSYLLDKSQKIK